MNKSQKQERVFGLLRASQSENASVSPFGLFFTGRNDRFPYPFLTSTSETSTLHIPEVWKGTPFGRSFPYLAIIRSTPPPAPETIHLMFTKHMLFNEHWPQGYLVKRVLKLASSIVFLLVIAVPKKIQFVKVGFTVKTDLILNQSTDPF